VPTEKSFDAVNRSSHDFVMLTALLVLISLFALATAWFLIFILAFAASLFSFLLSRRAFLKAFRPLGEYLSFASPKERYQRKGDPMSLESPLKNADLRRRRNSRAATVSPLKHSPS
jgi:hypothetical protein